MAQLICGRPNNGTTAALWARVKRLFIPLVLYVLIALMATAQPTRANDCKTNVGYRVLQVKGRTVAVGHPTTAEPALYRYVPNFSGLVAHDAAVSTACGRRH